MLKRLKTRGATVVLGVVASLALLPGLAFADPSPADGVITEVTAAFGEMETVVLALVAGLFALVIIGIAIRVGVKYAKRGGNQA